MHALVSLVFVVTTPELGAAAETSTSEADEEATETIVVTGSRIEQRLDEASVPTTVIDRLDLERSGARNLAEALESQTGLRIVQDVTGAAQVRLRGFDTDQVLILIDGQRVAGRKNGALDLSRIGVERIERIEIVKGPGSAVYGADALGGVINIITRRPSGYLEGDLRLSGGASPQNLSAETGEVAGRVGGRLGDDFDWQVVGSYRRRGAFDLEPDTPGLTGSAFEDGDAELSGRWSGEDWRLGVRLAGSLRRLEGVDSTPFTFGRFRIDDREQEIRTAGLHVTPEVDILGGTLRVDASASLYDETFVRAQRGGREPPDRESLTDFLSQLVAQYDRVFAGGHHLLAGAEVLYQTVAADRYPDFDARSRVAVFAQDEWALDETFGLLGGIRVDVDDQFGTFPTPRVSARYRPVSGLTFRGTWGLGYKAPLPRDLGIFFDNPGAGYRVVGNADLEPETASTFSASMHLRPTRRLRVDVELYRSAIDDLITIVAGPPAPPGEPRIFTYGNVETARLRGLEASVEWFPVPGLRLRAGYEALEALDLELERPLPDRPRNRVTAGLGVVVPEWGLDVDVRGAWTDARTFFSPDPDGGPDVEITAPPFVRIDARAELEVTQEIAAFVGADNILGEGDPELLTIPPRTIFGGIQSRFR